MSFPYIRPFLSTTKRSLAAWLWDLCHDIRVRLKESKRAVLVTGIRGLGGTVQYGNDIMPNVGEFCYLGMWMNRTVSTSRRMCGSMLAAWRQVLPVAIEHGVRDMPHAMMLLVRTFVLPRALYACQVRGPDVLQLSPCGQSSPAHSLSCCPIASMFWGCVAP
jgi:hypothetical protein